MPRRNLAIFPDFDGMLHKVFFLDRRCSGGQIFKQEIQGSGTLFAGLLAAGGGYDTGTQHIQCCGDLIEGNNFGMAAGFLNGLTPAKYTGCSEEQGIDAGILPEKLPGQRIAFKFIVMVFLPASRSVRGSARNDITHSGNR